MRRDSSTRQQCQIVTHNVHTSGLQAPVARQHPWSPRILTTEYASYANRTIPFLPRLFIIQLILNEEISH